MTTKILKCTAVFMCVCLLVTGLFTNVRIEAKTSDTGYTIDVTETEGGTFILEGNTAMVPQGITLLSLQDEGENEFDPYQFQMEVSEEKTYSFVLEFESAGGEVKSETIEAMVQAAPNEATESEVAAPASEMQQEESENRNAAVLTSTAVEQETSEVQDTQTVPEENQEWVAPSANNFQLETQYADDHSYMEVTLKNISGKDVFDIASVTDSNGNDHTFDASWRLNEEGTYIYEIKYYDNGTGEKFVESHQIVLDDLYQPKTILLSTLQARATTTTTISMYAYYQGTSTKVQEQKLNVSTGQIDSSTTGTDISGFTFQGIYLRKGGEKGVLYKVTSMYLDAGKIYYTLADSNGNSIEPSIAYEITQDEELGAYYRKNGSSNQLYTLSASFGKNVTSYSLIANDMDGNDGNGIQVYAGTEVGIRLSYKNSISTFDILINGQEDSSVRKEESKTDNIATYTFTMPEKNVNITGSPTMFGQWGSFALYDANNQYYNQGEIGYSALGTFGDTGYVGVASGTRWGNVVMAVGSGTFDRQGAGTHSPTMTIPGNETSKMTTLIDAATNWVGGVSQGGATYGTKLTNGKSVDKYPQTDADGKSFTAPLNGYERNHDLTFSYILFRGRPKWDLQDPDSNYYTYNAANIYIDTFPDQTEEFATGDYFTNVNNTVVREAIKLPPLYDGRSATTTLRSGAKVTVTVRHSTTYNFRTRGLCHPAGAADANFQNLEIRISGMYEDFRVVVGSISTLHKNVAIGGVSGIVTEANKTQDSDIVSYMPTQKGDMKIATGIILTNENESPDGQGTYELVLNPLKGYSIPSITKYNVNGGQDQTSYGSGVEQFEIVTGQFPDSNGLYHYKYRRNNDATAERIKYLDISSKLVKFTVDYYGLDSGQKPSYVNSNEFNAVDNTYFSIPDAIPSNASKSFGGWYVKVLLDRANSSSASNEDRYLTIDGQQNGVKLILEPNDLVSVSYLYELFASGYMAKNERDIGHTEYKLEFVPRWVDNNLDGAYKSNGRIEIYYQNNATANASGNFSGYTVPDKQQGTLISDLNYILGSTIKLGNYSETKLYNGASYYLNNTGSLTTTENVNVLLGRLVYDKGITVSYDLNGGNATTSPTDTGIYSTASGSNSSITLSTVIPTKNGQNFTGWKIVSGNLSSDLYETVSGQKVTVDLATLNTDLKESIYTKGTVAFVAQYQSPVGAIKHTNEDTSYKNDGYSWFVEGKELSITKTFKYDGDSTSYKDAKTQGLIHTAIYQQDNATGSYTLVSSDVGDTEPIEATLSESLDSDNYFTVTYSISKTAGYDDYNKDRFAIFSWTLANGASSFTDTSVLGSITHQQNFPNVPYFIEQAYILRKVTHLDGAGNQDNKQFGWADEDNSVLRQWSYENDSSIVIERKFKYDGDTDTFAAAKGSTPNSQMPKLHIALYRQESINDGGSEATANAAYELLDSDLRNVSGNETISFNVSDLDEVSKTFTVTYTIPKTVKYAEDNYDRYAILVWTATNGNGNLTDTTVSLESINKGNNRFENVPCYSQTVWVMKPYEIIGAENSSNIIARNTLKYKNDNGFTIQQEFKYDNRMSPDEVESEAITKVNLFKKDAGGGNTFLWVGTDISLGTPYEDNLTDNAMQNGNKRVDNYSITVKESTHTFEVSLEVLELAPPIYDTGAVWSLMCWNYSNTSENPYEVSSGNKNRFLLKSNYDSAVYPTLRLTTYIITGASIPSAMFNIPATATLYDIGGTTVGNENLQIEIKGVYNNTSGAIVKDDSAVDPSSDDVLHDSNYVVSANSSSGQDPKITMSQGKLSFDVYYYKNGSKVTATDTALGTLGFATNNAQQTLTFAIKGERSKDITTKDPFTGIGNFTITREKISNFVN